MNQFVGKSDIKVRIICDSINAIGNRLVTYEVEYPRIIHAELMTHRMLSRNAASSRAIPFLKMLEQLTAMPVSFGKNQSGMQAGEELDTPILMPSGIVESPRGVWEHARNYARMFSKLLADAGYHKQVFNRLTEPFQMIKVVVTATEWDNFFWLRDDDAADPTLHELASLMNQARADSVPTLLRAGEWHLPYVHTLVSADGSGAYYYPSEDDVGTIAGSITLEDAIKVSCARCAAVSFRNVDYGVEKSREVYERLVGDQRKHASAFEHCGTPMQEEYREEGAVFEMMTCVNVPHIPESWEDGISHMDRNRQLWSANFKGFIQYRKLIPGENYVQD